MRWIMAWAILGGLALGFIMPNWPSRLAVPIILGILLTMLDSHRLNSGPLSLKQKLSLLLHGKSSAQIQEANERLRGQSDWGAQLKILGAPTYFSLVCAGLTIIAMSSSALAGIAKWKTEQLYFEAVAPNDFDAWINQRGMHLYRLARGETSYQMGATTIEYGDIYTKECMEHLGHAVPTEDEITASIILVSAAREKQSNAQFWNIVSIAAKEYWWLFPVLIVLLLIYCGLTLKSLMSDCTEAVGNHVQKDKASP